MRWVRLPVPAGDAFRTALACAAALLLCGSGSAQQPTLARLLPPTESPPTAQPGPVVRPAQLLPPTTEPAPLPTVVAAQDVQPVATPPETTPLPPPAHADPHDPTLPINLATALQ